MRGNPLSILILEDNPERRELMAAVLADRFPQFRLEFFDAAQPMITRLEAIDPSMIALISLDHDLEMLPGPDGRCIDPGTGRDVADAIAAHPPCCPVVLHSTNAPAVIGMQMALEDADWNVTTVTPYDGHRWIETTWFRAVRNVIVDSVPAPALIDSAR